MIYGRPATSRFLAALQRLKHAKQQKQLQTRKAKQRMRDCVRKLRAS
jgi:hypothetical protein